MRLPPFKRPSSAELARGRITFFLDLSRGASVIASALKPETLARSIDDVMTVFSFGYYDQDLPAFVELLAERLGERGAVSAAAQVRARLWPELVIEAKAAPATVSRASRVRRCA